MKNVVFIIFLGWFLFLTYTTTAQARPEQPEVYRPEYKNPIVQKGFGSLGIGIGLPYGGLGARIGYNVEDRINIFTGMGYNFLEFGFNLGLQYDFAMVNRSSFYISAMGGYNAVIVVEGLSEYDQTFFGPSFGVGVKMDSKKASGSFWQFGIIVPIRSPEFEETLDDIKNDPRIDSMTEPFPILIAVGYNMGF